MNPLCVSLIYQYLKSTSSSLADEFKHKYQPLKIDVELRELLSKWWEEELAIILVYNYLKTVAPNLVEEFRVKYQPREVNLQLKEVFLKWRKEQLVRGLVLNHLKAVAPSLAAEFRTTYMHSMKVIPEDLLSDISKRRLDILSTKGTIEVESGGRGKQAPKNTFTTEELMRIKKAMACKENMMEVAKEMGRSYNSVRLKIDHLHQFAGMKFGKYSSVEIERMKQAVSHNEHYKKVAKELRRPPKSVHNKMTKLKQEHREHTGGRKNFSIQEDLLILDQIIPTLKSQKLSSAGLLTSTVMMELAKETKRGQNSVRERWGYILQPWLLQHYTGTQGFRVEKMLTSLVAQRFSDHKGIDWNEFLREHKEFVGHTGASLGHIFHKVFHKAKKGKCQVSLQEVADYAASSIEKKVSQSKVTHRNAIITYFVEKVAEFEINVSIYIIIVGEDEKDEGCDSQISSGHILQDLSLVFPL